MLDFVRPATRFKNGKSEAYPKFVIGPSSDLMIRGSDFYAVWNENTNLWSTKEQDVLYLIDSGMEDFVAEKKKENPDATYNQLFMWDSESGLIDKWHKYVQRQQRDSYNSLDEKLIFSNTVTTKTDYASKKLKYPLTDCPIPAYEELISTLYSPEERHKIEWAIGAIVSGDSKNIQKFLVLYGPGGTGKSTIINIIQQLFDGYCATFDSKALGSVNAAFALEPFKTNPLVAIEHDGDLSRIEDNTRINSLVSHEVMTVNEKFKSAYSMKFNCFLIMGTNRPVRITDSKSGIIRRLIDVSPTGKKIPITKYRDLVKKVEFELGGIATHCLEVYKEDPGYYDSYIPTAMIGASNDFYNFVLDSYDIFKRDDSTTLKAAYEMYKKYCDDAKVSYPYSQRIFKEELKSYFKEFVDRGPIEESGFRARNVYTGFIFDKFESHVLDASTKEKPKPPKKELLKLDFTTSLFDTVCRDCPAQYANEDGTPGKKWANVQTKLSDIDTSKLHYVKVPDEHIVIDFDIKDENGNKSFELNAEAAAKWPATYAELSKSGEGIHLHYIYDGDVEQLSRVYDENIEVKVFTGNSSLRRKLTKCNNLPIATINTGLPIKEKVKEKKKVIDFKTFENDTTLRKSIVTIIKRNLAKEYHSSTKQSIDFIYKVLEDAYSSGKSYDVSILYPDVLRFARNSTNNKDYCVDLVRKMRFKSDDMEENTENYTSDTIIFFDVEVFPNLFVVVYKAAGKKCVRMINPGSKDIEALAQFKLVGFNNRKYDNHILYGRMLGENDAQLYARSQALINDDRWAFSGAAYNLSYTDIYDYAAKKQSLKKWEIELGIHHQELGFPWDQPVPEDKWELVAEYCENDVIATEAVWNATQGDFLAREILADIAGGTINDTTNTLTTKLIFSNNRTPQDVFNYRDLSQPVSQVSGEMYDFLHKNFPDMVHGNFERDGLISILPFFPGYSFDRTRQKDQWSQYRGHDVGEGGFVWAKPGMYSNVITLDCVSQHPSSISAEYLFGHYTQNFWDLLQARIAIKHKDIEKAGRLFGGKLQPYLGDPAKAKQLAKALKIAINSVYGLTAQREKDGYCSPFRDTRNVDNIVAKRGALFMVDLLEELTAKGVEAIHCKTDSIKVVNPSPEIQEFIYGFGKKYGYSFEIEHKFEKICLVNNAVYIAKCAADDPETPGQWTATGAQFQVPYVFKTLFSHEPIDFSDMCEAKTVKTAIYLDMNEKLPEDAHNYHFVGKTGLFCPVKPGSGGGILCRANGEKYAAVTGTKGYRWLESEMVQSLGKEESIDKSYYISLVDEAVNSISQFGDFEWFVSDDSELPDDTPPFDI